MSTTQQTPAQELRTLALQILEISNADDLSKAELIRLHPGLGQSDKTITAIAKGRTDDLDIEKWLPAYRSVFNELVGASGDDELTLYEELSSAIAVRGQTSRLIYSRTLARILIIKGETGTGKTSALDIIREKYNDMTVQPRVFRVEASAAWGDRPNSMLEEMLSALGVDPGRRNATARLRKLADTINTRGVGTIIQVDEVHDFGVRCLRTLKTVISQSNVKIQLACHKRLFRTIETEHADDLSQLTGNRLLAIVELGAPQDDDVKILLQKRLPTIASDQLPASATELARHARGNGNLAFVREVLVRAHRAQAKTKTPVTLEDIKRHIGDELKARNKATTSL
ncbi:MAG: ATP-binding protein [Prosthecobacter sp.]|nr:ATP-binding protein [Prosthecobacter sp.]